MTRIERRVFQNSVLIGLLLTLLVLAAKMLGGLEAPENWMYDVRARYFQWRIPAPTTQLVHVDLDDRALDGIGSWPWPRSKMAELIDEMRLAGAAAIGLDILYTEPQAPTYEFDTAANGSRQLTREIDHDALLATAIQRAGNVLVPASVTLDSAVEDPLYRGAVQQLTTDLELTEHELADRLRAEKIGVPGLDTKMPEVFLPARRDAAYRRIRLEMSSKPLPLEEIRQRLLRRTDANVSSPLTRVIEDQYLRYVTASQVVSLGREVPTDASPLAPGTVAKASTAQMSQAAAASAFVDFRPSRDGILRALPLLVDCDGRVFPQMGLSFALLYLGVDLKDVQYTENQITIPLPDGRVTRIPVRTTYSDGLSRTVPMTFQIPWFGGQHWETMYDWPAHRASKQHVTMNAVWEPCLTRRKIAKNNRTADKALRLVHEVLGLPAPAAWPEDDIASRAKTIDHVLVEGKDVLEAYKSVKTSELDEQSRSFLEAAEDLKIIRRENDLQAKQLESQRATLAGFLKGKAVLVGWAATGNEDAVPTSLHGRCPGVVAHGVIFNSIVTGRFWRVAPQWVNVLIIVALCLMTTFIAGRLSPGMAFWVVSIVAISYIALNGLVLFNRAAWIVDLAAPQIAMAAIWSACTLVRIVMERAERERVTRRFRSYVDPTLVNYVIDRPGEVRLEGESRELTVCFSDLVGFTSLSERLGEKTVALLNEYMELMVPIIRSQRGYVNKFLGDGIMFFFGAPIHNADHAADAVNASLLMQEALHQFNDDLHRRHLPAVKMRIGVSTGLMVVGDAGSKDASDYTVLGDTVNFGARLESANKKTGTSILISARTAQLIGDRFLVRPVGSLQVVGKSEFVQTYEVCARAENTTDQQRQLCDQTTTLIDLFRSRKFAEAIELADELDETFGPSPLTSLYRDLCENYLIDPPAEPFEGQIVLSEK